MSQPLTPDLGVVLVSWNVRALLLDALHTLYHDLAASGLHARVIVVDNASHDGSADAVRAAFPQATVVALDHNPGFGAANNIGLGALGFHDPATAPGALPRAVYLLNPDTRTTAGATRALYDALMADASLGLVGARLSYGDASFQHSAFRFPGLRQLYAEFFPLPGRLREGRFNGRYPRAFYSQAQPFEADFVLGATMMLRREVVLVTRGFDPAFDLYGEEVDWAWRIRRAGWQVACVPSAHVVHLGGQSTGQVRPRALVALWRNRLRLYARLHPAWKVRVARGLLRLGVWRAVRRLPRTSNDTASVVEAYRTVAALAQEKG